MDILAYIRQQVAITRMLCDATTRNLTEEQFNWLPSANANAIRSSLIHLLTSEDYTVNTLFQGKPAVWEAGQWSNQIGLTALPGQASWDEVRTKPLPLTPVLAYQQALRSAIDDYLATLTVADLNRMVQSFGQDTPLGTVFCTTLGHSLCHAGEIAAVKGLQGAQGWPF